MQQDARQPPLEGKTQNASYGHGGSCNGQAEALNQYAWSSGKNNLDVKKYILRTDASDVRDLQGPQFFKQKATVVNEVAKKSAAGV